MQFNVSHSGERLVIAVAWGRRLGVDIERFPSLDTVDAVSAQVCSEGELEAIRRMDRSRQQAEFARLWTRKEAYVKAGGRGLGAPLNRLDVATLPAHAMVFESASGDWAVDPRWSLQTLQGNASSACCVAVEGGGRIEFRLLAADRPQI